MMNLGRGFSTPQQNGVVQNVDSWIPLTPQKPILLRSSLIPAEMQGNLMTGSNWQDLVGIYSGLLQENTTNSGLLQDILPSGLTNPIHEEHYICNAAVIKNGESFNYGAGHNTGIAAAIENRESFIFGAGNNPRKAAVIENRERFSFGAGSYVQKLGINPVCRNSPPKLQAIRNASYAPFPNGTPNGHASFSQSSSRRLDRNTLLASPPNGTPEKSIYISNNSRTPCTWSQLEGICSEYKSASSMLTKQNNLRTSDDNLSQAHRDGFPVPYWPIYDLNSPPRSEGRIATSTTSCFKFAPVTPDQGRQLKNQQLSGTSNPLLAEGLSQKKDNLENLVSVEQENVENHSNEFLQNPMDSSSADIAASLGNQAYLEGDQGGIDLNKTPKQKPPRRRKHRPKVVVEGKPKRTPKATTPKNNTSLENPAGKRKYVRKKGLSSSATEQCNVRNKIKIPDDGSQTKLCRRVLNFDLENQVEHENQERKDCNQAERDEESKDPSNLNFIFQDPECSGKINKVNTTSALHKENQQGYGAEKQHKGSKVTLSSLTNQMSSGVSSSVIPAAQTATTNNHTINVIARNLSMQNVNLYQTNSQSGYNQGHEDILGGLGNNTQANIDRTRQLLLQRTQMLRDVTGLIEQRGFKRAHCQTSVLPHQQTDTSMCSQLLPQGIATKDENYAGSSNLNFGASETCKKKKVSDISQRTTTSLPYCIPTTQGSLRQMETRVMNGVCTSSSISHLKSQSPGYNLEKESPSNKPKRAYQIPANQYINLMAVRRDFLKQQTSSEVQLQKEQIANKMSQLNSHIHSHNSLMAFANWNLQSAIYTASRSTQDHEIETSCTNMPTKKKTRGPATSKQPLSKDRLLSEYQSSSTKAEGAASLGLEKILDLIDQITHQLRGLYISDCGKEIAEKAETALVQYKGDGSIVPYEGFDPIKRRKPRPKVDLDPQTNRLWNLLMGKEGTESTETIDKRTEKWWEEERNVFQGRVDSFIARMHLVQGDRRFSPWKGSVVDSVIGVFLTQNVSDHLSSSAFMSLAAKFPSHPTKQASGWNKANPIVEEPVQIIDPDGTITYHASITRQPVYYQSSTTSSETSEQRIEDLRTVTRASTEKKNKRSKDDVISSQTSPDSFIYQALEEVRSSSGSNSEAEDQITLCNSHKNKNSEIFSLQRERTSMLQEYQNHMIQNSLIENMPEVIYQQPEYLSHYGHNQSLNTGRDSCAYPGKTNMQQLQGCTAPSNHRSTMRSDLGFLAENRFELPRKRGISSLALTGSNISMVTGIDHPSGHIGGMAGSDNNLTAQLTGTPEIQAPRETQLAFLDTHLKPISHLQSVPNSGCNQPSMHNSPRKSSKTIQLESTYSSEPTRPAEALPKCQIGETTTFNKPTGGPETDISNRRKRKAEGGRSKAFDWDSLRKQVLSNSSRKTRSKDATDSMDYEALRHADVKEISDTIKERGMNNMLAERIKDFLNRLVQEHESIDLEWLRDVPPDKAKNYLLSIRGLGLKSVECVRLLTLHHVAFPVDTNVGRIAVRLGWVPLQPLPESLQLHLLELYPVLESIQKYLWPRLCQLDQRTLYELHYQMITFGKVFCTKSKPNCNACPMRGDCRHFASAFASARLALPGPEERSIVNSTAPIAVDEIPAPVIKPMPLPLSDTNLVRETGVVNCCTEPIVQEPPSPELPTEVTESDIEDAFYDDPDEIPTIKLNIEEFTTNLQSFMQENIDMQEGDLSKAIVALNPQVASIPTPKLKNVSRLRTEHQVYELPDSHPLLKGLDRREPDDPSPYLLAIWTPGETANSIQRPESKCNNQASGKLCYENTCFSCNSIKEANSNTVRGTLLIPCRTAMRGSFPLNGTYFQVNEVFADHESSLNPIDVPRASIWNLPRRTVYFGTSVSTIFKGLTTEGIQFCFWRGFVCVRGFDQKTRAPRPLMARLHFPASKMVKTKNLGKEKQKGQAAERITSQRTS